MSNRRCRRGAKYVVAGALVLTLGRASGGLPADNDQPSLEPAPGGVATWVDEDTSGATGTGTDTWIGSPPAETPGVPAHELNTPDELPAACSIDACSQPTETPGASLQTVPVEPMAVTADAVAVEGHCAALACVGSFATPAASVGPTPEIAPVSADVPGLQAGAACGLEPACASTDVPRIATVTIPAMPSFVVAPAGVTVSQSDWTLWVDPDGLGNTTLGPEHVDIPIAGVGIVSVVLFPDGLTVPALPGARMTGGLTVTLAIGTLEWTQVVPIDVIV